MTNTVEFKIHMLKSRVQQKDVAERLGIAGATLSRKINNKAEFKTSEILVLKDMLNIENTAEIFFSEKVI